MIPLQNRKPLPMSKNEMDARGWESCDIILVSGDAYIDHPAFGVPLIGRVLERAGYRVGIIAQPDWKSDKGFLALGRPRLFFGVSAGNLDSMVAHYTVNRKKRRDDAYSPEGRSGLRPNRATITYTAKLKGLFKGIPVIIGGIEASLRRTAHYDYWDNRVRRSILFDSKADILIYGMAEKAVVQVANGLKDGLQLKELDRIPGTCIIAPEAPSEAKFLPSYEEVSTDKTAFSRAVAENYRNRNPRFSAVLAQAHGNRWLVLNPPQQELSSEDMDGIYDLPYTYSPHPSYQGARIPAYEQIFGSITSHRGCFGNCSFCAITEHQGSAIQSRSPENISQEATLLASHPKFRGTITDIGGPSANMYKVGCRIGGCRTMNCLFPKVCRHLQVEKQAEYTDMLREIKGIPGIKHLFVASGIRHDLLMKHPEALEAVIREFTGGHMKIAPEHISREVTDLMNKPDGTVYGEFEREFERISRDAGKEQYLVPYFISGHPGSTLESMKELKDFLIKRGQKLQQAADFYPTPMTLSTAMYYTGIHPLTGEQVYTATDPGEKSAQRNMMFWHSDREKHSRREVTADDFE